MKSISNAVLIGAGNVAWNLGIALQKVGIRFVGVCNRSKDHGEPLAQQLQAPFFEDIRQVPANADIYLLALSDSAIESVSEQLPENEGIVVHHSGSMSIDSLAKKHKRHGVFYCLQTFKKEAPIDFSQLPIMLQATSDSDLELLKNLALQLSPHVRETSDLERSNLHVAAVFACNFSNYLYAVAYQFAKDNNMDFNLLVPLIQKTAMQISGDSDPFLKQTGPAARCDMAVIEKHLGMLQNDPKKQALYRYLTECILNHYKN